ncbi:8-oxo-dGTP pyrophosphatase MutT (NUDIX family) [Streptomyces phaeochromogenes]|jgi:8-oxo-dGTP pyrophosphatase MutT (NUDIX family)|uniref:NUDIX hydrolase n=1 Tax=Streptomyces phaeochromogenes TaxID=1923 RepID=UPI00278DF7F5|nr:NUDIX domain-containing protein [Streptomyces phaeochromogenes]MDQ0947298.1 8-oxo-dGTP pyrophosphatase MutT (NUDIX family) [Streptomyces phaeochromogenes]
MNAVNKTEASDERDQLLRVRLTSLLEGVRPWDGQERAHLAEAVEWIAGGAPLHRVRKPDVPEVHLVSYFVVLDEKRGELLLVAHRKAGLWLPSGGHVEPMEDPWDTVVRECGEELRIEAVPSGVAGSEPFFLTITQTRGHGRHTDVSLWYVLQADVGSIVTFDEDEFSAIKWLSLSQVLAEPVDTLDPHMHRFTRKLMAAQPG